MSDKNFDFYQGQMLSDTIPTSCWEGGVDETLIVLYFDGLRLKPSPPVECLGFRKEFIFIAHSVMDHEEPTLS